MKKLIQKQWLTGLLVTLMIILVFLIDLWVMSLELSWGYLIDNLLSISFTHIYNNPIYIFAYVLMVSFYVMILPIVFSIVSLFRKKNNGFVLAGLLFLAFNVALTVFQAMTGNLPLLGSILVIVNVILILIIFTLTIIRFKQKQDTLNINTEHNTNQITNSNIPLSLLIINIVGFVILLSTFFIPIYTMVKPGLDYHAIMINVLFASDSTDINLIYFLVNIVIFLAVSLYFVDVISNYRFNKEKFIQQSKNLIRSIFVFTSIFFIVGLVVNIYYTIIWDEIITSISYIPMLVMYVAVFFNALLIGKYKASNEMSSLDIKKKYYRFEPLLFVLLLTTVTVLMNFLPIIKMDITTGGYSHLINLTGFNILRDYASLDPGYRIAAFILFVILISTGFCFIVAVTSYLSKSKQFHAIVKFTTIVNMLFVFVVAISGYYFQIARDINKAIVLDLADFYGYPITDTSGLSYVVGTDAIYALLASTLLLMIMFARKVFDRDEWSVIESSVLDSKDSPVSKEAEEETITDFDPCYSFTELDLKSKSFQEDLKKRIKLKVNEPTLNGLVHFVVDYAKNSRLHLSYTPETIATFVSGLGASKLSILQGMSGTGKTSLPKIFSEAIYGNCDIVEVESSWKDKNELLGYYNEFSMQYTPKKFTLALYKAALNQEIFTFILLDEMNLSRIEYYFSDFLSLMESEEDQRELKLVNINLYRKEQGKEINYQCLEHGHTLKIPTNVWFVGTANRDESTFVISDKVYDRAHTMNFTKRAPKVRDYKDPIPKQYYDYETMNHLFNTAKQNGTFDAEQSELIKHVEELLAPYNISFGNRILIQIEDFVNIYKECFTDKDVESEAIEKILLSKVVSKLEVKTIEDKEKLEMDFKKLNLQACADFIKHLDED